MRGETITKRRGGAFAASAAVAASTIPFVLPATPAGAVDTTCPSSYSCFGNAAGKLQFSGNNPSWAPWIGAYSEYWSTWGRNNGTSGMRACAFWDYDYVGLQVSLAQYEYKTYSSRSLRSNKWSSTTCSDVAGG